MAILTVIFRVIVGFGAYIALGILKPKKPIKKTIYTKDGIKQIKTVTTEIPVKKIIFGFVIILL